MDLKEFAKQIEPKNKTVTLSFHGPVELAERLDALMDAVKDETGESPARSVLCRAAVERMLDELGF